ncbi:MAG TPA: polysaccharide deacetylase family protein [Candidatus Dormibacteraeota bacterium]|nr:polysaccharide deacetylase family protein [Candidatus Dormibacteraeota bacterium]
MHTNRLSLLPATTLLVLLFVCIATAGTDATSGHSRNNLFEVRDGGIIRGPKERRKLALVFTGHEFAEGGDTILSELKKHQAKASFFMTGDLLANTNFSPLIHRIIRDGHYLGPHSDKHILYCSRETPPKTLVTRDQFFADVTNNLMRIEAFNVPGERIGWFLPAYEHYNGQIVGWTKELGVRLINFTPGTRSNADYTGEADKNFVSSQAILDSIVSREKKEPAGLNGFILLLHIGAGPGRQDKFHARFGELLDYLLERKYRLVTIGELLAD